MNVVVFVYKLLVVCVFLCACLCVFVRERRGREEREPCREKKVIKGKRERDRETVKKRESVLSSKKVRVNTSIEPLRVQTGVFNPSSIRFHREQEKERGRETQTYCAQAFDICSWRRGRKIYGQGVVETWFAKQKHSL